jgi:hypothetical protein
MSSSELSEIGLPDSVRNENEDQNRKLQEEIKAGVPDDILEIQRYDENGNLITNMVRIDEENKQVAAECNLPPIIALSNYVTNDRLPNNSASKGISYLDNNHDFHIRKSSCDVDSTMPNNRTIMIHNDEVYRNSSGKDFVFTSTHIKMSDNSNAVDEDIRKNMVNNKDKLNNRLKKLITNNVEAVQQSPESIKKQNVFNHVNWANNEIHKDDEEDEGENNGIEIKSCSSAKSHYEPEIYMNRSQSFRDNKFEDKINVKPKRNSVKKRMSELENTNSITYMKKNMFKITSQIE